jgi:hypothetical protein
MRTRWIGPGLLVALLACSGGDRPAGTIEGPARSAETVRASDGRIDLARTGLATRAA